MKPANSTRNKIINIYNITSISLKTILTYIIISILFTFFINHLLLFFNINININNIIFFFVPPIGIAYLFIIYFLSNQNVEDMQLLKSSERYLATSFFMLSINSTYAFQKEFLHPNISQFLFIIGLFLLLIGLTKIELVFLKEFKKRYKDSDLATNILSYIIISIIILFFIIEFI